MYSYLIWQLWIVTLSSGNNKDRAERGHVLQQGEKRALHSVTHGFPPFWDMWHEHNTGHAPACLAENLQPRKECIFNYTYVHILQL